MNEEQVLVKFKLTREDFCDFQEQFNNMLGLGLNVAFMIFISSIMLIRLEVIPITSPTLLIVIFIVLGITLFFFLQKYIKKAGLKQYENNKLLHGERSCILKPEGFEFFSEAVSAKYKWEDLYAYTETKDFIMIFIGTKECYPIPKKYLEDDSKIDLTRKYLKNIPTYKEKNKVVTKFNKQIITYFVMFLFVILILLLARIFL